MWWTGIGWDSANRDRNEKQLVSKWDWFDGVEMIRNEVIPCILLGGGVEFYGRLERVQWKI